MAGTGRGQAMQLERVGPEAVRGVLVQVARQVDDVNGLEGTLLDADAAADAELLADEGDLGVGRHLDAQLAHAHHRTRLFALLATLLGLAAIVAHDGYASQRLLLLLVAFSAKFVGAHLLNDTTFLNPKK